MAITAPDSAGEDSAELLGSTEADQLNATVDGQVTFTGPGFSVQVDGYEQVRVDGDAGDDQAVLEDITGTAERLKLKQTSATRIVDDMFVVAINFDDVEAITEDNFLDEIQRFDDVLDYTFEATGDWVE